MIYLANTFSGALIWQPELMSFDCMHAHCRIAGHHQLADRLIECQYELTDKLSNFVSGRKPVHSIGEHFLVPQVGNR